MGPPAFVEFTLGKLFSYCKGHEKGAFTNGPAFKDLPNPTIDLICPECGPSGSTMKLHHTQVGPNESKDRFPNLTWKAVDGAKEYILLCEDVDLPISFVVFHGLFYGIPGTTTAVTADDMDPVDAAADAKKSNGPYRARGGFKYLKNIQGSHYGGPKPVMGHGPHRYYYQLVALKAPVDTDKMGKITKDALGTAIVGNVVGWGRWIGVFERKWE
ncbi:hypothetical protein ACLMJK_007561 [Lecanora helva]